MIGSTIKRTTLHQQSRETTSPLIREMLKHMEELNELEEELNQMLGTEKTDCAWKIENEKQTTILNWMKQPRKGN